MSHKNRSGGSIVEQALSCPTLVGARKACYFEIRHESVLEQVVRLITSVAVHRRLKAAVADLCSLTVSIVLPYSTLTPPLFLAYSELISIIF